MHLQSPHQPRLVEKPPSRLTLMGRGAAFAILTGLTFTPMAQAYDAGTNDTITGHMNAGGTSANPAVYTITGGGPSTPYEKDFVNGYSANSVYLGDNTSYNWLNIENHGIVRSHEEQIANLYIGRGSASGNNSATVTGIGSEYTTQGAVYVGYAGSNNSFQVLEHSGARIGEQLSIGDQAGSNYNSATIHSTVSVDRINVGNEGSWNTLTLIGNGGNFFASSGSIMSGTRLGGSDPSIIGAGNASNSALGSNNSATIRDGGSWSGDKMTIGKYGSSNSLLIETRSSLTTGDAIIGDSAGSGFTANHNSAVVHDATWSIGGDLLVGNAGSNNSLTIQNGAYVSLTNGFVPTAAIIGKEASASGNRIIVEGFDSTFSVIDKLKVGELGTGNTLDILDNALVLAKEFSIASGNHLRLDSGFLALKGYQLAELQTLIAGGSVQWYNGTSWVVGDSSNFEIVYFDDTQYSEAIAFSGYGYTDYTFITSVAPIPEPGTIAFVGLGLATLIYARRKRS